LRESLQNQLSLRVSIASKDREIGIIEIRCHYWLTIVLGLGMVSISFLGIVLSERAGWLRAILLIVLSQFIVSMSICTISAKFAESVVKEHASTGLVIILTTRVACYISWRIICVNLRDLSTLIWVTPTSLIWTATSVIIVDLLESFSKIIILMMMKPLASTTSDVSILILLDILIVIWQSQIIISMSECALWIIANSLGHKILAKFSFESWSNLSIVASLIKLIIVSCNYSSSEVVLNTKYLSKYVLLKDELISLVIRIYWDWLNRILNVGCW